MNWLRKLFGLKPLTLEQLAEREELADAMQIW